MAEPTSSAVAAAWAVVVKIFPGIAGAAIAAVTTGNDIKIWQRLLAFVGGSLISVYATPLIASKFGLESPQELSGMGFIVGLFGWAVAKELFREINNADLIGAIKRRLGG